MARFLVAALTADFEGGVGYVIPGATRFPLAMALGATGSEELSYAAGRATAEEGRALGVNVDFYPVVDCPEQPREPHHQHPLVRREPGESLIAVHRVHPRSAGRRDARDGEAFSRPR